MPTRTAYIFVLTVIFTTITANAQYLKKFSDETTAYLEELEQFMSVNIDKETEKLLEEFIFTFSADSLFNPAEKHAIIEQSNELLDKNARANPHFELFLRAHLVYKRTDQQAQNYLTWQDVLTTILKKRKYNLRDVQHFLESILLLEQDHTLYTSSSVTWKTSPTTYTIVEDKPVYVEFNNVDLTCYAKRDSMRIFNTSGQLHILQNRWHGKNGLVTWERGGYGSDSVNAQLSNYGLDITRSEYEADSVKFTNVMYFDQPLYGTLNDRVTYIKTPESAGYPKFQSYQKNFFIEDLYPNITYEGGLSMEGAKLIGRGNRKNPANIYIFKNDTLLVNTRSTYFAFKHDRVISPGTSISILLDRDSIFHPDLSFTYRIHTNELTLLKNDSYTSQGPYFNSYHKVDMNFEQLYWNLNEPLMFFTAQRGASMGYANFESMNLFDKKRFDKLFGMNYVHPLISLRSFSKKIKSDQFTAEEYAGYITKPLHQVRHLLMELSYYGFIFYDVNTDVATIKDRLHDYIKADAGMKDYDVINFESSTRLPQENATFNINTFDLTINGIPEVNVSNQQAVRILPDDKKIILKRNRNFQFDGTVEAGLITFYGSNFFFHYDSFKVNLQKVDSMALNYLTGKLDNYGLPIQSTIRNKIEHITGEIYIDSSNNKSGIKDYPAFPLFRSTERSYVFYDKPHIQDGVYTTDQFYFELKDFTMDSLDNFNRTGLRFDGTLYSADIFPPIEQTLVLQKDESLGFHHQTETTGMPAYMGKGTYFRTIHLSNAGLKGNGELEYLTSLTRSKEFIFFPDSMNTYSFGFEIRQKTTPVEFPRVKSANNYVHWEPYNDILETEETDTRFNMFNDSTYLNGNLNLSPKGLSGNGRMDLQNSEIASDYFTYEAFDIHADTSDFFLKSLHSEGFTVLTENMSTHIDYQNKKGFFESNEDFTLVDFPENRYVSYLDYFVWHIDETRLEMGSRKTLEGQDEIYAREDGVEPDGPRYISVHPDQDSLNFVAPMAYYDYRDNLINAEQVKFIRVADARVYPFEGEVTVAEKARMLTLDSAVIIANEEKEYHRIYNASVVVEGRLSYFGDGDYDYVDQNGDIQVIHFHKVGVDDSLNTIANGEIIEPDEFTLSPVYHYQGDVSLHAQENLLLFDGATQIEHNCDMLKPGWLSFESHIDPLNIYIPIGEEMKDINGQNLYAGNYLFYDSVHIYPSFLTGRKNYNDARVTKASGHLFYNQALQTYQIAQKSKIGDFSLPGNYLSLHRENCILYGEGEINLGADLGLAKLETFGNVTNDLEINKKMLDLVLYLDFYLSDELKNMFAVEVDSAQGLEPTDISRETYLKALKQKMGSETTKTYRDEMTLFGEAKKIPEAIQKTIAISELELIWDDEANSYRSVGDIGIASIHNTQINKRVQGYFELQVKRSGDIMDLYLQIDRNTFYYFGYTRGVMHTLSSDPDYNNFIKELKTRDRKFKVKGDRTPYIFILAADRKRSIAFSRWKQWQDKLSGNEEGAEE
ncbi:MAG: hypothetical protein GVY19_07335 [Bacteroidetes bacterium]|jgi:hypothetical protein|nr:hypothetical protein [Bacteroidota bacterium]